MTVTTWFLEMTEPGQLRPARPVEGFEARPLPRPDAALSRSMYDRVGAPWQWTDRLGWGIARWRAHLAQPSISTWLGYLEGEEVGYAELARIGGDVEIASFGLLPGFAGRGMGGALLAAVTEAAWEAAPSASGSTPARSTRPPRCPPTRRAASAATTSGPGAD